MKNNKIDIEKNDLQSKETIKWEGMLLKQRLDFVAVVFVLLIVACRFLISTTFGFSRQLLEGIVTTSELFLLAIGLFKIIPMVRRDIKNIYLPVIIVILYLLFLYRGEDLYLLYVFVILGTIGVPYKRFLMGYVAVSGILLLTTVIASLTGLAPNLLYSSGVTFRDSFGIAYTTDFTSYVFYIFLFFWIAWDKLPYYIAGILALVGFAIAKFTDSDTCMICFGMLFMVNIFFVITDILVKKFRGFIKAKGVLDFLLVFSFLLFAL